MEVRVRPNIAELARKGGAVAAAGGSAPSSPAGAVARHIVLPKPPPAPPAHKSMKARTRRLDDNVQKNHASLTEHRYTLDNSRGNFHAEIGGLGAMERTQSEAALMAIWQTDADRASSSAWLESWQKEQAKLRVKKPSDCAMLLTGPHTATFGFSSTAECSPISDVTVGFSPPQSSHPHQLQPRGTSWLQPEIAQPPKKSFEETSLGSLGSSGTRWTPARRTPQTEPVSAITLGMEAQMRQRFLFGSEASAASGWSPTSSIAGAAMSHRLD